MSYQALGSRAIILFSMIIIIAVSRHLGQVSNQSSGYLDIRADVSMFYWLKLAGNETHGFESFPLVIALAGGPGDSTTGYTNFYEIGPVDVHGNPRKHTWLNQANILFLDNPVGCGYSFVRQGGNFTRNIHEITSDLVQGIELFLDQHPEFKNTPSYIFGESYGGKMAVAAGKELDYRITAGDMKMNLKGLLLADAWISPISTTRTWPEYLYALSFIDQKQRKTLKSRIEEIIELKKSDAESATYLWQDTWIMIRNMTYGIDLHHVFKQQPDYGVLDDLMNSQSMRHSLMIPDNVTWNKQGELVFKNLAGDFLNPVTEEVEYLLNHTSLKITVFTGQFDSIVTMTATEDWLRNIRWNGSQEFWDQEKQLAMKTHENQPLMYVRKHGKLSLYYVLRAGHSVATDQIEASVEILNQMMTKQGID